MSDQHQRRDRTRVKEQMTDEEFLEAIRSPGDPDTIRAINTEILFKMGRRDSDRFKGLSWAESE